MTRKEMSKIRDLGVAELEVKVAEFKDLLAKERALKSSGTRPEKPGNIRTLRRNIARHLTVITHKTKGDAKHK